MKTRTRLDLVPFVAIHFAVACPCIAAIPAFPGAEGGGAGTVGGRGGAVIEVANLNGEGPGSLRAACEASGKRTVVFRVGGTIDLGGKDIVIKNDYITIAGQTAPGDGIQIKGGGLVVEANQFILRYLRLRCGPAHGGVDNLSIHGPDRRHRKSFAIIDHVSAFWGVDETVAGGSFYKNLTFQWCIVTEPNRQRTIESTHHGHSTNQRLQALFPSSACQLWMACFPLSGNSFDPAWRKFRDCRRRETEGWAGVDVAARVEAAAKGSLFVACPR